ncbi:carbohydrate-binding protein [Salinicola aestuarinus]|uniref:carbohydrate-binding protein n=1 Tax=Salinicola aestuarinus TaxID=1949082 RepID=UPI000DA151A9|nr:carbohydrate-binding protein [Salinicola aestuarinus]
MFTLAIVDTQTGAIVETLEPGDALSGGRLDDRYRLEVSPQSSGGFEAATTASVALEIVDAEGNASAQTSEGAPFRFTLADLAAGVAGLTFRPFDAQGSELSQGSQVQALEIVPAEGWHSGVFGLQGTSLSIDDGASLAYTVVRDASHPESNPGAGADGLWNGHSGEGYLDMGRQMGDATYFDVTVETAGTYQLDVRYASSGPSGMGRPMAVRVGEDVQGTLDFPHTGSGNAGWQAWEHATVSLTLEVGTQRIRLENLMADGPNIDSLSLSPVDLGALASSFVIQAEDPALVTILDFGASDEPALTRVVDADHPDAAGNVRAGAINGGYVDIGSDPGDALVFHTQPSASGLYTATIRYANGGTGDRPMIVGSGEGATTLLSFPPTGGWNQWGEVTVSLPLRYGGTDVKITLPTTDEGGMPNGPNIDQILFDYASALPVDPSLVFEIQGEALTPDDGTSEADTVVRDALNPESNPAAGSDGLWGDYTGTGYLDMGGQPGDAAGFEVSVNEAGTYLLTVRYASGAPNTRQMTVSVDGELQGVIGFTSTGSGAAGWENWSEKTYEVDLEAGANTVRLANVGNGGPNIDRVSINTLPDDVVEPGDRTPIRINFQPDSATTPEGYVADTGLAFGQQSLTIGGVNYAYGWVTEASIADGTANGTTPMAIAGNDSDALGDRTDTLNDVDPRQATYAGFDKPGYADKAGWEIELEDGYYEVTISIGDSGGAYDSVNVINAEGEAFNTPFTSQRPANFPEDGVAADDSAGYRSSLVTRVVQVVDGRLTLDAIGINSVNTEIQYLEIQALPDLTPDDERAAPLDYAQFISPRAVAGVGEREIAFDLQPQDGSLPVGIDPTSDFFIGLSVVEGRGGVLLESLNDGSVRLFETVTGNEVAFNINTTGGFDSLTISPQGGLEEFTSYTLVIDGFQDRGSNSDSDAPTREFQKFTSTFVTGAQPPAVDSEVGFSTHLELDGAADGAYLFTSITMSPDNTKVYVSTMNGEIKRFDIDPDTGDLVNPQTLELDYFQGDSGARGIVGLTFDPTDPNVLWVTDNDPIPLTGRDNGVPDFSGRVSKVTIGENNAAFTGTAEPYITGLPRSNGDHVTNSVVFQANDAYDPITHPDEPPYLLYLSQGANTAMGQDDSAWGNRPERLLNASVLEIDPYREAPPGGFDVSTEPLPTDGSNGRYADDDNDLKNGPIDMGGGQYLVFAQNGTASVQDADGNLLIDYYDPFADDAVLKIYATGIRNAYDLVWHSNGSLYLPTNGSASGGSTPDDPSTPQNEGLTNVGKQDDYLFKVERGGYYGHPNPLHDQYILNGGNPTAGVDPNEVVEYPAGQNPDPGYDIEDAYSLGENRSPNGAIEYVSNVFGATLMGSLLFVEYSGGNDIRWVSLDEDGNVAEDTVLRDTNGQIISYVDPLDIIENPLTGQLYLMTLNRSNGQSQIVRLDPVPGDIVAPGDGSGEWVSLVTIQAEDETQAVIASGSGAEITIRDGDNPEPSNTNPPYGVRPGAFGVDGNTDYSDGIVGGYADFGNTSADFITFNFDVGANQIGDSVLRVRYANGSAADRPLEVFVNGESVGTFGFSPPTGVSSGNAAWNTWQTLDIPAELISGANSVRFQAINAGPNIDQLEVLISENDEPESPAIDGRYEAEAASLAGGAVVIPESDLERDASGSGFVDFVGNTNQSITWDVETTASGVYEVTVGYSLTAGKADRPMGLTVNGVTQPAVNFPALSAVPSDWVTQTFQVTLAAGDNEITLTAPRGVGPDIDYLQIADAPLPGTSAGSIAVTSTDPTYFPDRVVFNYLEQNDVSNDPREYKDSGSVVIANNGSGDLSISDVSIDGPFRLADPDALDDLILAPGSSIEVEVFFDRAAYTPPTSNAADGGFEGTMTITSNDADQPVTDIQLAGFWQARDEGGWEPNLNEIWHAFGFGNHIEGLSTLDGGGKSVLQNFDLYQAADPNEVLSRYWQIADGATEAKITQIAAFHGASGALVSIHAPGDKSQTNSMANHDRLFSQAFLPKLANGEYASETFGRNQVPDAWLGDDVFGISVANLSTDPSLNPKGGGNPPAEFDGVERGYTLRAFQAVDQNGDVIPNVYFLAQDYTGINYDYNDNVYLVEGIQPAKRAPFTDDQTPWTLDQNGLTVEAANFDEGAPFQTYRDASEEQLGSDFRDTGVDIRGDGDAIGWVEDGEWVEYTIEVEQAGVYDLSFLSALGSQSGGARTITATFDGGAGVYAHTTASVGFSGGWSTFLPTEKQGVLLEAGEQVLRVTFNGGSQNLESFSLTPAAQSAFNESGTPWLVDGELTLGAAMYDEGGPEVAYHDGSEEQLGTDFRGEGVDIRGNGEAIGYIEDGEWVEYTLDVAEAGTYALSFSAATRFSDRSVTASVQRDGDVYASAEAQPVINSGGWNDYVANDGIELDLAAGEQTLRLTFNGGSMNIADFTLSELADGSASAATFRAQSLEAETVTPAPVDDAAVMSDDVALAGYEYQPVPEIA